MGLSIALLTISDTRTLRRTAAEISCSEASKPPDIAFTSDNSARMIVTRSAVS